MTTQDIRLAPAITLWHISSSDPKIVRVYCFRTNLAILVISALEFKCLWPTDTVVHLGSRSIRTGGNSASVRIRGLAGGGEQAGERFVHERLDSGDGDTEEAL
jgi:hypothetical protein